MKPTRFLGKLEKSARKNFQRLQRKITTVNQTNREAILSYVVIESLNSWRNFVRAFYLSCAFEAMTNGGARIRVSPGRVSLSDALGKAIHCYKPNALPNSRGQWDRRVEPNWHDTTTIIKICTNLGCSNLSMVNEAFSIGSRVFEDLPVFRNFYAHRNQQTEMAAKRLGPQYGISAILSPSEILFSWPLGRPQPLILEWIDDLLITIEYLVS